MMFLLISNFEDLCYKVLIKVESSYFTHGPWLFSAMSFDITYCKRELFARLKSTVNEILSSLGIAVHLHFVFSSLVVLSSDDEDGSSEPEHSKLLQDNIPDNKKIDHQPEFSAKQLEDEMETHTEQVVHFFACVLLCQPSNSFLPCLFFLAC